VVGVALDHTQRSPTVEFVRYAGLPLAHLGGQTLASQVRVELWGLADPPEGANSIALRLTEQRGFVAGAAAWSGVDPAVSTGALVGATGTSAQASVTAGGSPGGRVVDVYGSSGSAAVSAGPTLNPYFNLLDRVLGAGASRPVAAGGSSTWQTAGAAQPWALIALPLEPAAPPDGGALDAAGDALGADASTNDAAPDATSNGEDGASADAGELDAAPDTIISGFGGDGGDGDDGPPPDGPAAPDAAPQADAADGAPVDAPVDAVPADLAAGARDATDVPLRDAAATDVGTPTDASTSADRVAVDATGGERVAMDAAGSERPAAADAAAPDAPVMSGLDARPTSRTDGGALRADAAVAGGDGRSDDVGASGSGDGVPRASGSDGGVRRLDLDVGCACRVADRGAPGGPWALAAFAAVALARLRRRPNGR
jgi:MYXO-CTERM domain-containing protein